MDDKVVLTGSRAHEALRRITGSSDDAIERKYGGHELVCLLVDGAAPSKDLGIKGNKTDAGRAEALKRASEKALYFQLEPEQFAIIVDAQDTLLETVGTEEFVTEVTIAYKRHRAQMGKRVNSSRILSPSDQLACGNVPELGARCGHCHTKPAKGSKLRVCGRCKCRSYCDTRCQKLDWAAGHKQSCFSIE